MSKGAKQEKKGGEAWPSGLERTLFSPVLRTELKECILGKRYDLSFAFVPPREMRKAMAYKRPKLRAAQMKEASNVLSFPLSKTSGEILICKSTARAQCNNFGMDYQTFLAYLFIHGSLHLKGLDHGATMEHEESRVMRRFGLRVDESR